MEKKLQEVIEYVKNNPSIRFKLEEAILENQIIDNLPEHVLHTMPPSKKKDYLYEVVFKQKLRYNGHTYDINDFTNKFPFVLMYPDRNCTTHFKSYKDGKTISISNEWENDLMFQHLIGLQKGFTKTRREAGAVGVWHTPLITYCLLIRYNGHYQIYVGRDKNAKRWDKSGNNHFASIRDTLKKEENTKHYPADLALTYFGPDNAVVFAIGDYDQEGDFTTEFPMPDGSFIKLRNDPIALKMIAGCK